MAVAAKSAVSLPPPPMARKIGAMVGAIDCGSALAMLKTPKSLAASLPPSGNTAAESAKSIAR